MVIPSMAPNYSTARKCSTMLVSMCYIVSAFGRGFDSPQVHNLKLKKMATAKKRTKKVAVKNTPKEDDYVIEVNDSYKDIDVTINSRLTGRSVGGFRIEVDGTVCSMNHIIDVAVTKIPVDVLKKALIQGMDKFLKEYKIVKGELNYIITLNDKKMANNIAATELFTLFKSYKSATSGSRCYFLVNN